MRCNNKMICFLPCFQVFFKGEFMGGCDIMIEMHQSGELIEELDKIGIKSALKTPAEE